MKPTTKTDAICIEMIQKYIYLIGETYKSFDINNLDELESNAICQLAIAQAITNIHEVQKKDTTGNNGKAHHVFIFVAHHQSVKKHCKPRLRKHELSACIQRNPSLAKRRVSKRTGGG